MTGIQRRAIADAERDFRDVGRAVAEWALYVKHVRAGSQRSPFLAMVEAIGAADLCQAWSVDVRDWRTKATDWQRDYDGYYLSAIEVLVRQETRA